MRHTFVVIIALGILIPGCSATQQETVSPNQPEIISMTALPPLGPGISYDGYRINVLFKIRSDGSVAEVRLLRSSGGSDWDAAAIDSMKQWHFTASPNGISEKERWIRSAVVVQAQQPSRLNLGEIRIGNREEADSLCALLENGVQFETLVRQPRPGTTTNVGNFLGFVDISRYPHHVRSELQKLSVNGHTQPLRIGSDYVIFKRFGPEGPRGLPQ